TPLRALQGWARDLALVVARRRVVASRTRASRAVILSSGKAAYNGAVSASALPVPLRGWAAVFGLALFAALGLLGAYRYVENYWVYRGFAPPHDAAYVTRHGTATRFYLASAALGGRKQPVDVYL